MDIINFDYLQEAKKCKAKCIEFLEKNPLLFKLHQQNKAITDMHAIKLAMQKRRLQELKNSQGI